MRLVDADRIIYHEIDEIGGEYEPYLGCSKDQICNLPTIEAIPVTEKAFEMFETDYKNRLKADRLSMLYKLRSEIINMPKYFPYADHTRWFIDGDVVVGLIDNEIDALRENEDRNDDN